MRVNRGTGSRPLSFVASLAFLGALASPLAATDRHVDCRAGNPSGSPYTSITAAINSLTDAPPAGAWDQILLRSDCKENVVITRGRLWIAPEWDACPWNGCTTNGPLARITAADPAQPVVRVEGPHDLTLVHVALSNGSDGLAVRGPAFVDTYGIVAENNSANGVSVEGGAMVALAEPALINNGGRGLNMSASTAEMYGRAFWLQGKPCLVSGNGRTGMFVSRSVFKGADGCVVENNQMRGVIGVGGHVEFGAFRTEAVIRGNQGGALLVEGTEATFWGGVVIQDNGPFGLHMERQSQAGFHECCGKPAPVVEGHTETGVTASQHSQLYFKGASRVRNNGTAGAPLSAGLRVDGNSAAFLDGGAHVDNNAGPGVLVDLNSSLDAQSSTIQGNAGEGIRVLHQSVAHVSSASSVRPNGLGPITCDGTSLVITDLMRRSGSCANVEQPTEPRPASLPLEF
jgi:hypothetical protein